MCDSPGTTSLALDHQTETVHGYVICGCGEHKQEVPISPALGQPPQLGIEYKPEPR
jgi:hypothetical protein